MRRNIAVIDYGAGNLHNVCAALRHLGAEAVVAQRPEQLTGCDGVVFPGVGVWGSAVEALSQRGLWTAMAEQAQRVPFLGICLGMQLLFETSEESPGIPGLGLLEGQVARLPQLSGERWPSIGWRPLQVADETLASLDGQPMYFVHGYHAQPVDDQAVCAVYAYGGQPVVAMVRRDNVVGCQFHPEKSGQAGLKLLAQLMELPQP